MVNIIVVGAAALCCACTCAGAIAYEFGSTQEQIRRSLVQNAVSWSPTEFVGRGGTLGHSPIFGLIWISVWLLCGVVFPIYCVVLGLSDDFKLPEEDDLLNATSFVGAGLIVSGTWAFIFTLETPNSVWAAAAVNTLGAVLALTGVCVYRPFSREIWHVSSFVGVPFEFAAGWVSYMAALSISMAVHVTDHGGDAKAIWRNEKATQSFVPISAAGALACFAFVFGAPVLTLPLALAMLFSRQGPWIWGAFAAALAGCGLGILTVVSGLRLF